MSIEIRQISKGLSLAVLGLSVGRCASSGGATDGAGGMSGELDATSTSGAGGAAAGGVSESSHSGAGGSLNTSEQGGSRAEMAGGEVAGETDISGSTAGEPAETDEQGGDAATAGTGGEAADVSVGGSGNSAGGGPGGSGGQLGTEQAGAGEEADSAGSGGDVAADSDDLPHTAAERITFGTTLDPMAVVERARELAATTIDPDSPQWQAKGDQHRTYNFAETQRAEPYRLYVPSSWDWSAALPLVMFLHGGGSDENTYVDQNGGQLLDLAEQHGVVLVSPKGADGAYGNFLRLSAPFGNEAGAAELMAQVTPESERTNELSEQDVINVLELVLHEYPIDRTSLFLAGHSMGSGGTWYIGGKYSGYWAAIAPMSGPFVQETGYPWEDMKEVSIFVSEGSQTPSLDGSRLVRDWLSENGFKSEYLEVESDHGGMVGLVLPNVFDFFAGLGG